MNRITFAIFIASLVSASGYAAALGSDPIRIGLISESATPTTTDLTDRESGESFHVEGESFVGMSDLTGAKVSNTEGQIVLNLELKETTARKLREYTQKNAGKRLAVIAKGQLIKALKIKDTITGKRLIIGPLEKAEASQLAQEINHPK